MSHGHTGLLFGSTLNCSYSRQKTLGLKTRVLRLHYGYWYVKEGIGGLQEAFCQICRSWLRHPEQLWTKSWIIRRAKDFLFSKHRFTQHSFLELFRGPEGFSELREACCNNFHHPGTCPTPWCRVMAKSPVGISVAVKSVNGLRNTEKEHNIQNTAFIASLFLKLSLFVFFLKLKQQWHNLSAFLH